jgi:ribonuclease J
MSALSRLAVNEVKGVEVEEGDVVILSTRIIPGNEKLITSMVNHFCRRGAEVFDTSYAQVHVSGHGYGDDLKLMMNLVRPKFFVPIHGEYRQLKTHQRLAWNQGFDTRNTCVIENGDVLRLTPDRCEVVGRVTAGRRFIQEGAFEEVHDMVLRDRRFLSEDGFVVVVLRLDRVDGDLLGEPEIISRGFVTEESAEGLLAGARAEVARIVRETAAEEKRDEDMFKEILRRELKRFLRKQTGKRPIILPVTLEI